MIPVFRGCFPFGSDLNVSALRSRLFSSSKLLILASATMMSGLVPSTAFAQKTVAAKPPVSPEMLAVHSKAKRPVATTPATTPATTSVAWRFARLQLRAGLWRNCTTEPWAGM